MKLVPVKTGSRNPEKGTGFRVKRGMTFDTPLLASGQFIEFYPGGSRRNCEGGREYRDRDY